ncbi:adenylate/guanylate cyclase domain-containing protein [Bradyrhizobium diazoefficiens]
MQIAEWLEKLGLGQYAERFVQNGVDMGVLPELMDEDFDKLGVLLGHRRKMLRAIADLDPAALIASPAPPHDAERRHLTVMFCDLVGSTALSARLDPEDMWEVIRAYRAACARVISAYDGSIARFVGDGILVYFGYPRAHEDDAERAVRAGLDAISAMRQLKTSGDERVELRIAIATGLVVVGDLISGDASEESATVGDTPNLAARLQSLAEPGAVVVASSTRRLLGDLFTFRNLGRREVKGISEPIAVWAVEGAPASESRFEAVHAARSIGFVGRKEEIELTLSRQRLAWQGQGQMVLISGEAGIGKSRMVAMLSESPVLGGAPPRAISVLAVPHQQCASSLCRATRARCRHLLARHARAKARQARGDAGAWNAAGCPGDGAHCGTAFDPNRRPLSAARSEPGAAAATDLCHPSRSA